MTGMLESSILMRPQRPLAIKNLEKCRGIAASPYLFHRSAIVVLGPLVRQLRQVILAPNMPWWEYIVLGADALFFTVVYRMYRSKSRTLDDVKSAPYLDLAQNLGYLLQYSEGNEIPYAVIRGRVKALGDVIQSSTSSGTKVSGVIQEKLIEEHKVKWSWGFRQWHDETSHVSQNFNTVPFALCSSDGQTMVEVVEPLVGNGLKLQTINDVYEPRHFSFWDSVTGFFGGEWSKGLQHIERMLTEGTPMTAVGSLVWRQGTGVQVRPPADDRLFYFTPDTDDTLIRQLSSETKFYKVMALLLGSVGALGLAYVIYREYEVYRKRAEAERVLARIREERTRQEQTGEQGREDGNRNIVDNTCLICMVRARDIVLLDCGHICCCLECGQALTQPNCPVCRAPIVRMAPAFVA